MACVFSQPSELVIKPAQNQIGNCRACWRSLWHAIIKAAQLRKHIGHLFCVAKRLKDYTNLVNRDRRKKLSDIDVEYVLCTKMVLGVLYSAPPSHKTEDILGYLDVVQDVIQYPPLNNFKVSTRRVDVTLGAVLLLQGKRTIVFSGMMPD